MRIRRYTVITGLVLLALGVSVVRVPAQTTEPGAAVRLEWIAPTEGPMTNRQRVEAVAKVAGLENWPRTEARRLAPHIDKKLLSDPTLVTGEWVAYDPVLLGRQIWGQAWWSWKRRVPNPEPLPTELPPDVKEQILKQKAHLSPEAQAKILAGRLKRYRESKKHITTGQMELKVVTAPSCRAAQEYLIWESTQCSLATHAVASAFRPEKRLMGLGTIGFRRGPILRSVRDNICVIIRGTGDFGKEVLPLAKKIDGLIQKQPVLTERELMARRPTVRLNTVVQKAADVPEHQPAVAYNVTGADGLKVLGRRATINGQYAAAKEGRVLLGIAKGTVRVRLTVIVEGLLASTAEADIVVGD